MARRLARDIIQDLPEHVEECLAEAAQAMQGITVRTGSIFTGSNMSPDGDRAVVETMCEHFGLDADSTQLEQEFGVEVDAKKRQQINARPFRPCHLFGDAKCLSDEYAWCYTTESWVKVGPVDWLSYGFVCKQLSSAFNDRKQYDRCILAAIDDLSEFLSGLSGATCAYALRYVKRFGPALAPILAFLHCFEADPEKLFFCS